MSTLSVPLLQYDFSQQVLEAPTTNPRPATLPVPNPTRSFWVDTPGANPLAREGSDGPLTNDADVCIIGSGITGVSAAYHLSKIAATRSLQSPLKAVIVEARDFCSGATGRNGGHLTPFVFVGFHQKEQLFGTSDAAKGFALENHTSQEIVDIIHQHGLGPAVDLVKGGHITLFVTDKEEAQVRADYDAAKAAGVELHEIKWISKEEMRANYGASFSGVQFHGHNLWPLKFVTELFKIAKSHTPEFDLSLHTNTPVTAIYPGSNTSSRRWVLSTPRGTLRCSHVIHATNAYASHLLPQFSGPTGIIPTRGQIIATRAAVSAKSLTKSSWDGNEGFEYWFPRPVQNPDEKPLVILGGGRESSGPAFELYQTDDSRLHPEVGEALRGFLPGAFPGKYDEGTEPEMEWTGIMGYTKLGDPFVGPVLSAHGTPEGFEGQYISAGYTGHGMPRGYACAEVVANMIGADLTGERWSMPNWLPKHYLTENRALA
ncbi:FAD dependent oxidoreductase [Pluteus cervinus]|uniref:FAD dependent oxidoreductase n=1 Tax=Pluteus cervinus TaxID=181527 RepID=A0ACD3ATK8_9AGAR|nr:FAD dependent oxidoreductase [Pluteus cervinus]